MPHANDLMKNSEAAWQLCKDQKTLRVESHVNIPQYHSSRSNHKQELFSAHCVKFRQWSNLVWYI